ncbi:hypothetical protein LOZ10_004201 [Ophidiomyces ophidiicola]|nr:hypothetical protein LOZ10_004201 [Ophidiomyces ophidiicola]
MDKDAIYKNVQKYYNSLAAKRPDGEYNRKIAEAFGYNKVVLENVPKGANLGLCSGNPVALADLKHGETVVDFGSGAGMDIFLAAEKVGSTGIAIGIDINQLMLDRANKNKDTAQTENVSFVKSLITNVNLPDGIANCIISNCVVNLVPAVEKQLVFNEMFRLLKPGGRVAMSDILAKTLLPPDIRTSMALYVGCIAGASLVSEYRQYFLNAGFKDAVITPTHRDLNAYHDKESNTSCCGDISVFEPQGVIEIFDFNKWAGMDP